MVCASKASGCQISQGAHNFANPYSFIKHINKLNRDQIDINVMSKLNISSINGLAGLRPCEIDESLPPPRV